MTAQDYMAPESVGRLQQRASVAGIVGLVACGICVFLYGDQYADRFFHSYLIAFMFVLGLSLGSLGLLMVQHDSQAARVCHPSASCRRRIFPAHRYFRHEASLRRMAQRAFLGRGTAFGSPTKLSGLQWDTRFQSPGALLFPNLAGFGLHLQSLVERTRRQPRRPRAS